MASIMKCIGVVFIFISIINLGFGQGQSHPVEDLDEDGFPLPPPVKPEPRLIKQLVVPPPQPADLETLEPVSVIPEPRQSGGCNYAYPFTAVGQQALLQSPNWPNDYPAYQNCRYTLTSPPGTIIGLQCTEFNVESSSGCSYDVFYISPSGDSQFRDALRTCGRGTFSRNSTSNALSIGFDSDAGNPFSSYPYRYQCTLTIYSSTQAQAPTTTTVAPPPPPTSAASSCQCGIRNEAPRIVGGTQATLNEFPWRCNLYHPQMGAFCGATVISNQWILTAAHCTAAVPAGSTYYVDCADHDISSATETANVVTQVGQVIQHSGYNKDTQDNDISLIKLTTPLTFSRAIQPVCLPWNMVNTPVNGLTVTASGWGTVSSGGSQSVVLKKVDLPVVGTDQCKKYYGSSITNNMICTYAAGSDTCQGDSGGSIDYKNSTNGFYYDLGVVSWGVGCAGKDQPGVYTKVTNYLDWITTNTAGATYCRL